MGLSPQKGGEIRRKVDDTRAAKTKF